MINTAFANAYISIGAWDEDDPDDNEPDGADEDADCSEDDDDEDRLSASRSID